MVDDWNPALYLSFEDERTRPPASSWAIFRCSRHGRKPTFPLNSGTAFSCVPNCNIVPFRT
ncbi:hypothetical protein J2S76_003783 [Ancylobacter vacuolatus]|uniref:Uncharacterized protein n=1 Tax=Ancylobacter vacuolatus TaxID=223389 RepID=A0ABU0DLM3_9HYPH|nr:hypothetical protein [Ancylobacter vacuolatus]